MDGWMDGMQMKPSVVVSAETLSGAQDISRLGCNKGTREAIAEQVT